MTPSTDTNSTATSFLMRTSSVRSCLSFARLPTVHSSGDALPLSVCLKAIDQLLRVAKGEEVPAGHLVEGDAQTLPHYPALEFHREEAVVATLQEPRRHLG